jgi:hypothetical protein
MIVGVFGDSFGEPLNDLSWTHVLTDKYLFEVKNYAQACTTTFWSYCQLLDHIHKIDTVVFVLTEANRLHHSDNKYRNVCTLNTAQHQLKNNSISQQDREIYQAAEQYHLHLTDYRFNQFVQDQIVKQVQALTQQHNKKLILIPAFRPCIQHQTIFQVSLFDVTMQEIYTNFDDNNFRQEKFNQRSNHLSRENNEQLASIVADLISNKVEKITMDNFIFTKYNNPELYWEI